LDHAGNSLTLTMKVKCEPDEYELSVMELRYDPDPQQHHETKPQKPQRNTIEFERLMGRGLDHPLLCVTQEVSFGEGDGRSTVEATWDVLHDEPEIEHSTGDCNCGQDREGKRASSDQQGEENDPEQRGLILLRIVTDKGRLKLEE
jgi:hypothetical protein